MDAKKRYKRRKKQRDRERERIENGEYTGENQTCKCGKKKYESRGHAQRVAIGINKDRKKKVAVFRMLAPYWSGECSAWHLKSLGM